MLEVWGIMTPNNQILVDTLDFDESWAWEHGRTLLLNYAVHDDLGQEILELQGYRAVQVDIHQHGGSILIPSDECRQPEP